MVTRPHLRLDAEQFDMLENHFNLVDGNGDGRITKDEFRLLFRSLGQTATNRRLEGIVEEAFKEAAPEGLDCEEFMNTFMQTFTCPPSERAVREALMLFDKANRGYIDTQEFVRLLTTRGEKLEQREIDYLFELLNIPPNTKEIDYTRFAEEVYRMLPILSRENI
ncbi:Calmodulin-like protein 3 [Babesia sp. Xinjiang]|uniref:Calmodulin-like protein 3 n=1 Tax=Babesia sp. Xinjiang TaxID=462227 RepID=UPI000A251BD1|nr:Calmodulin-like protein 3 [Babesia sp. Xinjiang]ORM39944.1 Calmodulin-like protein 3 [Babesia sp. Xinjiang]